MNFSTISGQKSFPDKGRGLKYSAAQDEKLKRQIPHVRKVHLNALGLERINKNRRLQNLPVLTGVVTSSPSGEVETAVEGASFGGLATVAQNQVNNLSLPPMVDNSIETWFPPIGDQGALGSCISFATTYYQLSAAMARANGWVINNNGSADYNHIYSPKFTYNLGNGGSDLGQMFGRSYYDILAANGAPPWSQFPYDGVDFTSWPTSASVWESALPQRIDYADYVSIPDSTAAGLSQVKLLLLDGHVLTFETNPDAYNMGWITSSTQSGLVGQPAIFATSFGYDHLMTIVGYDDNMIIEDPNGALYHGAFKLVNQWGTLWGISGIEWVAYDAVNTVSKVAGGVILPNRGPVFGGNIAGDIILKDNGAYVPQVVAQFTVSNTPQYNTCFSLGLLNPTQAYPRSFPAPDPSQGSIQQNDNGLCQQYWGTTLFTGTAALDLTDYLQLGKTNYFVSWVPNGSGTVKMTDFRLVDSTGKTLSSLPHYSEFLGNSSSGFAYLNYDHEGPLRLNITPTAGGIIGSQLSSYVTPHSSVSVTISPSAGYKLFDLFDLPSNFWADPTNIEYLCYADHYGCVTTPYNASTQTYSYTIADMTTSRQVTGEFIQIPVVNFLDANGNPTTALTVNNASMTTLTAIIYQDGLPLYPNPIATLNWLQVSSKNGGVATFSSLPYFSAGQTWPLQVNVNFSKPDVYDLRLNFSNGRSGSSDIIVSVTSGFPTITVEPQSANVNVGQAAQFSVSATGTAPLTYSWLKNGVAVSGATKSSYTTPNTLGSDDGSTFQVVVKNSVGTAASVVVPLILNGTLPNISVQPVNQTVSLGDSATFKVTATGQGPFRYQWYLLGLDNFNPTVNLAINGATSSSYKTPAATAGGSGNQYMVVVSNPFGSTSSNYALLTIKGVNAPNLVSESGNQTVTVGKPATFSVKFSGTGPLAYQWFKYTAANQGHDSSLAIAGATDATYTISSTSAADNGYFYFAIAYNASGSASSNTVRLTVNP